MASKRERVLEALLALIKAAVPLAKVERSDSKPQRADPGGNVVIADGDPGEPEVDLGPLAYNYDHVIPVFVVIPKSQSQTKSEALDAILVPIGLAIEANRTLGGVCEFLQPQAVAPEDVETTGTPTMAGAVLNIVASYATSNPLT